MPRMTLERMLRYVVLACIFIVPFLALYVARSMFFPFITGKNFGFRILVEIALSGWLALMLLNAAYRPKKTWLLWAFTAFVLVIGVADIFGAYPLKSFWSNYERMEGWVTLAHLFAYFVVAVSVVNTEKLWRAWWHTSLGVSLLVGLFAILQLAGVFAINQGGIRLDATLGNATYLGIYMLFHVFVAALLYWRERDEANDRLSAHVYYCIAGATQIPAVALAFGGEAKGGAAMLAFLIFTAGIWVYAWARASGTRLAEIALATLIVIQAFALFFTSTRGAILGLIGGAAFATLLLIAVSPRSRLAMRSAIAIGALIVAAGAFWMVRDAAWVHSIEPLHRLATLLDGTVSSRFMNWEMAWQGVQERPILGWGQENYAAVFDKYYNPDMWGQEPWFDRTHDIVMDWLIAGGFLGLFAYLSLYAGALLMLWRSVSFAAYERAILTGLLAGYFFYLLFTFDNILSYILFASILAYIAVRASEAQEPLLPQNIAPQTTAPILAGIALVIAGGLVYTVNADGIRQNHRLIAAIQPQTGGAGVNLQYFRDAAAYQNIGTQEAREQLSQAAISVVDNPGQPAEVKQAFLDAAAEEMKKQIMDAPGSARAPFFLGILYDHAGVYDEAQKWLTEAHQRSPKKQSILFELGLNAYARGATTEAFAFFKEAYELAPEYHEAQSYYAAALIRAGNDAEAERVLAPRKASGDAADQRIATAYAARGRYDKIVELWTDHVGKKPQDLNARFVLASAYYAAGDVAAAIRELEATKIAIPSAAAQADELILQARSGVPVE